MRSPGSLPDRFSVSPGHFTARANRQRLQSLRASARPCSDRLRGSAGAPRRYRKGGRSVRGAGHHQHGTRRPTGRVPDDRRGAPDDGPRLPVRERDRIRSVPGATEMMYPGFPEGLRRAGPALPGLDRAPAGHRFDDFDGGSRERSDDAVHRSFAGTRCRSWWPGRGVGARSALGARAHLCRYGATVADYSVSVRGWEGHFSGRSRRGRRAD